MCRFVTLALVALSLSTQPVSAQRFRPQAAFVRIGPNNISFVSALPPVRFVEATLGTINVNTRMFNPTFTGATSILRGQGVFMPSGGTFVPANNGNFLLTTREALNVKTGKFAPSPTGNFVFSQRGDLVSNGTAVASFVPLAALSPLSSVAPLAAASTFATNPYAANPYLANPYASGMVNPYMATAAIPYVPIYPPPYPTATNSPLQANTYATAAATADSTRAGQQAALASYGIPYENGHIKRPLAFRLLPPDKKQSLADGLERDLVAALAQGAMGTPDASLLSAAKRNLAGLSSWLTGHRDDMAEATYRDGQAFLRALDEALAKY
jgi:hypothetical protein